MTETDERYAKILKSLESEGQDFDEFGDNDKDDIDRNFEVPSVKPERKAPAPENWGDGSDVISMPELMKMREEDEAGLKSQKFSGQSRKSTEDWDDVISMKELMALQNEEQGIIKGTKFDEALTLEGDLEDSAMQASYDDMLKKKHQLDNPDSPGLPYQYDQNSLVKEGDGYEEPYGSLLEPAEDEDDDETFGPEAFGTEEDENPEFKMKGDKKGIVEMGLEDGLNSRKFWDEAITTEDEEVVKVGYNPHPNKELDMPKADFKKKRPADDLEGIESIASEGGASWDEIYNWLDTAIPSAIQSGQEITFFTPPSQIWNMIGGQSVFPDEDSMVNSIIENWVVHNEDKVRKGSYRGTSGGTYESIASEAEVECPACKGTGYDNGHCERCDGTGKVDPKYGYLYEESWQEDEDELKMLEDPVKDIPKEDFEDEMYDMLNHDKLNDTQSTDIYGNDDANSMTPASGFTGKMDHDEAEGSMGDIWNCPECGFKTASKPEFDDHSQSHSAIPADTGESFDFEDLGTDDDILSKFRNE